MILIDTHAVIWLTEDQTQLSKAATQALIEARVDDGLTIADITLNEIAFLIDRGRVTIKKPLKVYLRFLESMFTVLPITALIADQSTRFGKSYPKDPADRLIGATAVVHELNLVTKDKRIRASKEVITIW